MNHVQVAVPEPIAYTAEGEPVRWCALGWHHWDGVVIHSLESAGSGSARCSRCGWLAAVANVLH